MDPRTPHWLVCTGSRFCGCTFPANRGICWYCCTTVPLQLVEPGCEQHFWEVTITYLCRVWVTYPHLRTALPFWVWWLVYDMLRTLPHLPSPQCLYRCHVYRSTFCAPPTHFHDTRSRHTPPRPTPHAPFPRILDTAYIRLLVAVTPHSSPRTPHLPVAV